MSPRFQRMAVALPFVRQIARRRSAHLFDLCAGFVYAQVLAACVELDLFRKLQHGARPLAALAEEASLPEDALLRLAKAAAALSLLVVRDGGRRLDLGSQGAALLGNPSVFEMVNHHKLLYQDLAEPVAMLRAPKGETNLGRYWGYARQQPPSALLPEEASSYSALMEATQAFITAEILAVHDFRRCRHVMDVGGGTGAFLRAVGRVAPQADLTLFDLPAVIERCHQGDELAPPKPRLALASGDFHRDPLPEGADLISLVRILHDHDDDEVERLLMKVHKALAPGGQVLVAEPMANTNGAQAMGDAYFGIYLWAMGTGEPRTPNSLSTMMVKSGFSRVRRRRTRNPLLTGLLIGEK